MDKHRLVIRESFRVLGRVVAADTTADTNASPESVVQPIRNRNKACEGSDSAGRRSKSPNTYITATTATTKWNPTAIGTTFRRTSNKQHGSLIFCWTLVL